MEYKKVRGFNDYFDHESKNMSLVLENIFQTIKLNNFKYVYLPIVEYTSLFKRQLGEGTDIVQKELFTFNDKKARMISLRPEGTIQITRMILENKLCELNTKQNLFYFGPMFRYERPQKGRHRQFYQVGIESYNDNSYIKDIEIILLAKLILDNLEIKKYNLIINSIGSIETRIEYKEELKKYLIKYKDQLSDDSKKRFENNVLRILDSKDDKDQGILLNAPSIIDYLSTDEKERFDKITSNLRALNVNFIVDSKLVRGLDYYNDIVFEFISNDKDMGKSNTLIAGGRYDKLANQLNHKKNIPAIGFALGVERITESAKTFIKKNTMGNDLDYLVVSNNDNDEELYLKVINMLNELKLNHQGMYQLKKISSLVNNIKKINPRYVIFVNQGIIKVKDWEKDSIIFENIDSIKTLKSSIILNRKTK